MKSFLHILKKTLFARNVPRCKLKPDFALFSTLPKTGSLFWNSRSPTAALLVAHESPGKQQSQLAL